MFQDSVQTIYDIYSMSKVSPQYGNKHKNILAYFLIRQPCDFILSTH